MNLAVIVNPYAGRGRVGRFMKGFLPRAEASGRRIECFYTEGPGHAIELARSARSFADAVCVIGGDGTVHEVANGLLPDPVPIAVIPCGSGDDFSRLVGCPQTPGELFQVLDEGKGVKLDVIDCGERFCVNSCGLGFEAQVTRNSRSIRWLKGLPLYLLAAGKALARMQCPHLTIRMDDGRVVEGERLLVSVGNGVSAGGGFYLTPDAVPDDGLMDMCVVEKMGRGRILRLLPLSLKGAHTTRPEVEMHRTRTLTIESRGPLPVLCKSDAPGRFTQPVQQLLQE
jgi:YegS/Rv2252/BmrU family lipid kinase